MHPEIPALVRAIKSRGLVCSLSSNLNVLREPEALLAEHPDYLRVSVSGFTQEIYARGHREGDIERVKHNMGRLAAVERAGVSAICDKPFEAGSIRRLISESLTR